MKFNNGAAINFDIIKKNKDIAIKEIAEGNIGLDRLMNYCVDNDIRTYASCGDDAPYISFELNDNSRDMLFVLIRKIQSNQKLFNIIIPSISLTDGFKTCSFHYCLNEYGIDANVFFDLILDHFINYYKNQNVDIEEFLYSEILLESLYKFNLNSCIEYFEIKEHSTDRTELSQYKITIYSNSRDYILKIINENFKKFIYSSENNEYIINMKYYEIMNFDDLKDSCHIISKEEPMKRILKRD